MLANVASMAQAKAAAEAPVEGESRPGEPMDEDRKDSLRRKLVGKAKFAGKVANALTMAKQGVTEYHTCHKEHMRVSS